jgi:hypothetical protein
LYSPSIENRLVGVKLFPQCLETDIFFVKSQKKGSLKKSLFQNFKKHPDKLRAKKFPKRA